MANFKIDDKIVKWSLGDKTTKSDDIVVADVKLPSDAPARMKTLKSEGKKWYLTMVSWPDNPNKPFALFCHTNTREPTTQTQCAVTALIDLGKSYEVLAPHLEVLTSKFSSDNNVHKLTRTISFLLRHNVPVKEIVEALDMVPDIFVGSFLFQIKKYLASYIMDGTSAKGTCTECGSDHLQYSEGCMVCLDCGHSKCG